MCIIGIEHNAGFVINGRSVSIQDYPFYVEIRRRRSFGGGAILNKRWILTASHVVDPTVIDDHFIHVGTSVRKGGKVYRADKIIRHPSYSERKHRHDIALVRLKKDLVYSPSVQRIELPPRDGRLDFSEKAMIVGLGMTSRNRVASVLQAAKVPTLSNKKCGVVTLYREDSMLCAVDIAKQRDAAGGDSGGPLFVEMGKNRYVIGIVSYGAPFKSRVVQPGYYARVSQYIDWIKDTVAKHES